MVWPFFDQLLGYYREKPDMLERICKSYKHAVRSARQHFAPCLDDMVNHHLLILPNEVTRHSSTLGTFVLGNLAWIPRVTRVCNTVAS